MFHTVIILGFILRIPLLFDSLWLDEAIEAQALMGKLGPILSYSLKDFQPPLYHFLLVPWTHLVGYSELALRTPSFFAGIALIYFGAKLASLFNRRAFIPAGLLLATNPLLIYYSSEGRTYILTACFATISFYYLARLLLTPSRPLIIGYFFSTLAMIWSSYLSWFLLTLQLFYLLRFRRTLIWLPFTIGATLIFWFPSLLSSLSEGLRTLAHSPSWGSVVGGLSLQTLALTWVKPVFGRISFSPPLYLTLTILFLFLHGLVLFAAKKRFPLLYLWLTSIPLVAIFSFFLPVYSYFRLLFVVPAYLILLALGLSQLPRFWTYLLVISQLFFYLLYLFTPRFHKEDWRSLTIYLNQQSGVVAMPNLAQRAPLDYYGLTLPLTELRNEEQLSTSAIYYLRYVEEIFDPHLLGRANLTKHGYTKTREQTFPGLALEIYEK